jgi:hypothetical protein
MIKPPIKRIELEFIDSNVSSFSHIVQLNFIKEPGSVGTISLLSLDKYTITVSADDLEQVDSLMNYMGDSIYMSEAVFMGGLNIGSFDLKDKANLKIPEANLLNFKYLLDYIVNPSDVVLYMLRYGYKNTEFTTPMVISYLPLEPKPLSERYIRPCITAKNSRFRGPNESVKDSIVNLERSQDIKYLEELDQTIRSDIETHYTTMDAQYRTLYNMIDKVKYLKHHILDT